ncbi:MAG: hypothetical protein KDB62_09785, partial [Solirubrobacterales bacterium]|nr:hypothetical protein [Solirubrobacterales bacterium]
MVEPVPLSPEDRVILEREGRKVAGHACKVIRLEPPGVDYEALFAMLDRRIRSVPELRSRVSADHGPP